MTRNLLPVNYTARCRGLWPQGLLAVPMYVPSLPLKTEAHTLEGWQPQTSLESIW